MDNRFCGKGLFVYAVICLFGKSVEIHLIRLNQWQKRLIWLFVDLVIRQWEKLLFAPYRFWKNVKCNNQFYFGC